MDDIPPKRIIIDHRILDLLGLEELQRSLTTLSASKQFAEELFKPEFGACDAATNSSLELLKYTESATVRVDVRGGWPVLRYLTLANKCKN